jgi:hypothetical protein
MLMPLPPIDFIESGRSILFLGAGFSAEATNIAGKEIKDVRKLTKQMLDACGIIDQSDYDLETAADEYTRRFDDISDLLHTNFSVASVTKAQRIVVCQPWYRIYTSNYDNVVEQVCSETKKIYTIKETSDKVEPPFGGKSQLIHIYVNLTRASTEEFRTRFLLTERQRDTSPFLSSPWFRRFADDVLSASTVVFVGFSLSDLDIRRLLKQMPSYVHEKIFFVGNPTTSPPTVQRLSSFGKFDPVGVSGLAAHLSLERPGLPVSRDAGPPPFVEELRFLHSESKSISSSDIQYLIAVGILDKSKLAQSDVTGRPGSYTITRGSAHYHRSTRQSSDNRPVVVHSDIGNGKTIFALQCAYILTGTNHRAFLIQRESERDGDVIAFLQSVTGPLVVIFDDILKFKTLIKRIIGIGRSDLKVIATARSGILESAKGAIDHRMGRVSFTEVDLNVPPADEISRLGVYLRENGLLGSYADFSDEELRKFLAITCGGQLRDIILALFEISGA